MALRGACVPAADTARGMVLPVLPVPQVDILTGLNMQLSERPEALQGDVQRALQETAKRVLAGVKHHGDMHQETCTRRR